MDEVTTLREGNYSELWVDPSNHRTTLSREFSPAGRREDVAEWERAGTTGATQHASTGSEMQVPRGSTREREAAESSSQTAREGTQAAPRNEDRPVNRTQGYHLRELNSASARVSLEDFPGGPTREGSLRTGAWILAWGRPLRF